MSLLNILSFTNPSALAVLLLVVVGAGLIWWRQKGIRPR